MPRRRGLILLLTATIPGLAQPARLTAEIMLPACHAWLAGTDTANAGTCAGFVVGVADALVAQGLICVPSGRVSHAQLVKMVIAEIEAHPELLHQDFIDPTERALIRGFPCEK